MDGFQGWGGPSFLRSQLALSVRSSAGGKERERERGRKNCEPSQSVGGMQDVHVQVLQALKSPVSMLRGTLEPSEERNAHKRYGREPADKL